VPTEERPEARPAHHISISPDEPPSVRPVDVEVVRPLRAAVLRPGRPLDASVYPGEDDPRTSNVAAYLGADVVAVGTVFPDRAPWAPDRQDAWRIRGMATRDDQRVRGVGRLVLDALIDHAAANGGRFIWCEARIGAPRFYVRAGFVVEGEPFMLEDIEHVHMWRDL
jgi:GNAT superfamily N-acetyltransferase